MRHRKNSKRLSRNRAHRKAVLNNLARSLLQQEKITTTLALAKEARRLAEKLITMGKKNTVAARRQAYKVLKTRDLVKLLFTDIAVRFANRLGGYTRIVHLGQRRGDNAKLAILELTEIKKKEEKKHKEEKKQKKEIKPKKEEESLKAVKEVKKGETKEAEQIKEKEILEKKEKHKPEKEELPETKEKEKPKQKEEERKGGFLGGLRKFLKKQDKSE